MNIIRTNKWQNIYRGKERHKAYSYYITFPNFYLHVINLWGIKIIKGTGICVFVIL